MLQGLHLSPQLPLHQWTCCLCRMMMCQMMCRPQPSAPLPCHCHCRTRPYHQCSCMDKQLAADSLVGNLRSSAGACGQHTSRAHVCHGRTNKLACGGGGGEGLCSGGRQRGSCGVAFLAAALLLCGSAHTGRPPCSDNAKVSSVGAALHLPQAQHRPQGSTTRGAYGHSA